jgi:pyruvate formate lyase activating enzyme
MHIGGLQKTSTLDYPGLLSAVVFTSGCNFHCPYCHNPDLAEGRGERLEEARVFAFLDKRQKLLDAVVVSGGEPTLQPELPDFCARIKALGYKLKLDTNGSRPDVLATLLRAGLVDYLALDLKAPPLAYPQELCSFPVAEALGASLELVRSSGLPHEFRATCIAPFITADSVAKIAETAGSSLLFLQQARLESVLDEAFFRSRGIAAYDAPAMEALHRAALRAAPDCRLR